MKITIPAGRTSYGVHFAEVLVDKETKDIKVVDFVAAVHDVGRVINPSKFRRTIRRWDSYGSRIRIE